MFTKLFFAFGPAATGKSTFREALKATMGDYAATADFETFLARSQVGGIRNDVACLNGARLVVSIEVDKGKRLAEGLVKTMTGGDTMRSRFLYQESFEFRPQFKLWLAANHAPKVRNDDMALWRRILRVPFDHTIPEGERDPAVKATLRDPEKAGAAILAWAVRGCLEWQRDGLEVPDRVKRCTDAYRDEVDPLADFIEECCEFPTAPGAQDYRVRASELQGVYRSWAESRKEKPLGKQRFVAAMKAHNGIEHVHSSDGWWWKGIRVRPEVLESVRSLGCVE